MMQTVMDGVGVLGGAVVGSFAAGALPVPAKFKPFLPLAGGIVLATLPMTRKQPMLRNVAIGMVVISGMSILRQFAPQIPLLTGEVDEDLLGATTEFGEDELEELLGMGYSEEEFGEEEDMMGQDSLFVTAADI